MDEATGTVIAAIAAGIFGIGGVFAGLFVGRRQTVDQAAVEHRQWLRGQRQLAYTALFPAWDAAVTRLRKFQYDWEDLLEQQDEAPQGYEPWFLVQQETDAVFAELRPHIELCELLGPENVNQAAEGLHEAFRRLRTVMQDQARREPYPVVWETWEEELGKAEIARLNFQLACISGLRRTPSTDIEDTYG